jgi:hypothetical protein
VITAETKKRRNREVNLSESACDEAEKRVGVAALEAKDFKKAKTAFDRVLAVATRDATAQYLADLRCRLSDLSAESAHARF